MIEKVKGALKYIVLPLTLLFAFIYYLLQQISSLKSTIARKDAEAKISDTLTKLEEAKYESDEKEKGFRDLYDDYVKSKHDPEK